MKYLLNLTFSFLLVLTVAAQENNAYQLLADGLKKYTSEQGIIVYEVTGDASGEATLVFKDYGWTEEFTSIVTLEKYGVQSTTESTELSLGDYKYSYKSNSNTGKKVKESSLSELMNYKSNDEAFDALFISKGGVKSGSAELIGKTCNKWTFSKGIITEIYEWEGIPLLITKKLPGLIYSITAVEYSTTDDEISDSMFSLPEGVEW